MLISKQLKHGKTRWRSNAVLLEVTGVELPKGAVEITVDWIYTTANQRRLGLATTILRMLKRQAIKQNPGVAVSVYAVITSTSAYRLFRKVFGRPALLMRESGTYYESEKAAVAHLPAAARDPKSKQTARKSQFVEAVWRIQKYGIR